MGYTIRTIEPQYITVNGFNGPEVRQAPDGFVPPQSFVRLIIQQGNTQLWEDTLGTATEAEYMPLLTAHRESYLPALWSAADKYQMEFISSVAIGLLTIGVIQQKQKALAVLAWTQVLWGEYYARKAAIMAGAIPNYDFTSVGPIPYSVRELQAELGM